MRWQQTEFILKGIYLGLLFFVALQEPTATELQNVALWTVGGLVLFVGLAALRKLRQGYRPRGRGLIFLLFVLLENPTFVYAGVLLGLAIGAFTMRHSDADNMRLLATVGGGAVLGVIFYFLRTVRQKSIRRWLSLGLAAALVAGGVALFYFQPELLSSDAQVRLGYILLMGIPLFYLLTFVSLVEESEVEIAAICAALGLGLWLCAEPISALMPGQRPQTFQIVAQILVASFYVFYTRNVMPSLRVWKHILRGVGYSSVGQNRPALISLGRALQLDPNNKIAMNELWRVHTQMDFSQIAEDRETLALVDFELCLERAGGLLIEPPSPEQMQEAQRLLDLVAVHKPIMLPRCQYWRSVAYLHEKKFDEAAQCLIDVLSGGEGEENPHRQVIALAAWKLAYSHPEMHRRVWDQLLARPGRRMDVIAAIERQLQEQPNDAETWKLKRQLYAEVKEEDYNTAYPDGQSVPNFAHDYAYELGMALISDAAHWQRGAEYLRIAARGLPQQGPTIMVEIARASEKAGDIDGAWQHYKLAKRAGQKAGANNLTDKDRDLYFQVVKMLADARREEGKVDEAIENYKLYAESGKAGKETYRYLAELYQAKNDVWSAMHAAEHALTYDPTDADLLQKKDTYYYSITPEDLRNRKEQVQKWFDTAYCIRKARSILNQHSNDWDLVEWANHLLELAYVMQPESISLRMLRGRVRRLQGELEVATKMLEEVRTNRPEKFPSEEEEESWYTACKLLGDLYLNEKPDKALECFREYQKFPKSGADTLYKIGVAYEHMGDRARACKYYEQVLAYEGHPLYYDARDALDRIKAAM